jgi:SpoIID/LytB domain protein
VGVFGAAALRPRLALAGDVSLNDRLDLLYSNQFNFGSDGQPRVSIGLIDGADEVMLEGRRPVEALPSGTGGTAIRGGRRWRIRLARSTPAVREYRVVVASARYGDTRTIDAQAAQWRRRGEVVSDREVGALFGMKGRSLDTRQTVLVTDPVSSRTEAERRARVLDQRYDALGRVLPTVTRRAAGRLIARDLDTGMEIEADGVLWFAPSGDDQLLVRNVLSGVTMGTVSKHDRRYRGEIYVAIGSDGKLTVVNQVKEADVLAGLVPAEIYASAGYGALRAQAVAARGQLLAKVGTRHLDDPYLLCAHQHCQVYAGSSREHPRTSKAVRDTIGHVLLRPNRTQLVDTVYSANSGGHTEDNDLVWPSPVDDQLRARPDPLISSKFAGGITRDNIDQWLGETPRSYSRPSEHESSYRWAVTLDAGAIAGNPGVPEGLGRVRDLQILKRGRSGRAIDMRLYAERGEIDIRGELAIRRALGGLKSSMFIGARTRSGFHLVGGGHGHGVGMCQHGAMGMAAAGKSHSTILAHYYKGGRLETLW